MTHAPINPQRRRLLQAALFASLGGCQSTPPVPPPAPRPPKIGYALGGGAARGFAHVGVIKMLESQGIVPDVIVGTSAGSVVGALYAAGNTGFQLQEMTFDLDRAAFADLQWFTHGLLKGEKLETFIDQKVGNRRIEQLPRRFAAVAAKLHTGEAVLLAQGDVGQAVRASSAVPGVFESPIIDGVQYVDGGTVSPVPVRFARTMGADIVIAVDISSPITNSRDDNAVYTVLKTFDIMGQGLRAAELPSADVVIAPQGKFSATNFNDKQRAILEGERAALAAVPKIRELLARYAGSKIAG